MPNPFFIKKYRSIGTTVKEMELARSERSMVLKKNDKTLRRMMRNLSTHKPPNTMFSALPSRTSIFGAAAAPTRAKKKRKKRKRKRITPTQTKAPPPTTPTNITASDQVWKTRCRTSDQVWKTRCRTSFQHLLRSQDSQGEFTHISKLLKTKSIKIAPFTQSLSYEDVIALFWQIGERCTECIQLDISHIQNCTFEAIRALLTAPFFGKNLIILRARNQNAIDDHTLRAVSSRCFSLKVIDFSSCPNVTDTGLRFLVNAADIEAISLSGCQQITGGTLRALTGELSHKRLDTACTKLELLDLSSCPKVHDLGWKSFGDGGVTGKHGLLKRLKYLNLSQMGNMNDVNEPTSRYRTTEKYFSLTLKHHGNVLVLNISLNSDLVTDRSMKIIGSSMNLLLSLNVAKNRKITDAGVSAMAQGCVRIQAVNLSGLGKLTTPGIYTLLRLRSQSLKLLNLSGLQGTLPTSLLHPLCKHLPYAQIATTFYGFRPISDVIHQKLIQQQTFIEHAAAAKLQAGMRGSYDRAKVRLLKHVMANRIQVAWRMYSARKKLQKRRVDYDQELLSLATLQKWARALQKRRVAKKNESKQARLRELLKIAKVASTIIVKTYRGHFWRTNRMSPIADIMVWLNGRRFRAKRAAFLHAVVRLQRNFRKRVNRVRRKIEKCELEQRRVDCFFAVCVLQQSIRMYIAKMKLHRLWDEWNKANFRIYNAAVMIQCMVRCFLSKQQKMKLRWLRREGILRKHNAAAAIQAAFTSGPRGRVIANELFSKRNGAAIRIQSLARQRFVGHWSSMAPNLMYEKWNEKSSLETMQALQNKKMREKMEEMKKDGNSASESDEEWEAVLDEEKELFCATCKSEDTNQYDVALRLFVSPVAEAERRLEIVKIAAAKETGRSSATRLQKRKRKEKEKEHFLRVRKAEKELAEAYDRGWQCAICETFILNDSKSFRCSQCDHSLCTECESDERRMFFSAKRNATRKDPMSLRSWEKSLVGKKIMLFDEWEEQRWVHAFVKQYNSWKNKWKIIFAGKDGDYKWINMHSRHDIIMMRDFDGEGEHEGDWCMLRLLFPKKRDKVDL